MTTREEHLAWCKQRALEILDQGDLAGACASMLSNVGKWDGGQLYDQVELAVMSKDAAMFCQTQADMRNWIEGFD